MSNIVDLMKKKLELEEQKASSSEVQRFLFTLDMYQYDDTEELAVEMVVDDNVTDEEVFAALYAAFVKFGLEHGLLEDVEDDT